MSKKQFEEVFTLYTDSREKANGNLFFVILKRPYELKVEHALAEFRYKYVKTLVQAEDSGETIECDFEVSRVSVVPYKNGDRHVITLRRVYDNATDNKYVPFKFKKVKFFMEETQGDLFDQLDEESEE